MSTAKYRAASVGGCVSATVEQRAEPVQRRFRRKDRRNKTAPKRCLDEVGSLGKEAPGAFAPDVALQLGRSNHPGRSLGER